MNNIVALFKSAGEALPVASTSTTTDTAKAPPEAAGSGFSATVDGYIAAAQSEATKRAYAQAIRHFEANGGSIPASPEILAEYLARFAGKLSVATLELRMTAIHKQHLAISAESPAQSEMVKRVMQGIRRKLGTKQRQVQPILKDDILSTLVMVDRQKPVKAARDRALLLIGFAGAFRRSELVAVKVEHITHVSNGIEIFLPKSKTDQEGSGRTVFIPHSNGDRCPVRALAEWLAVAQIDSGFVFRSVTRHDRVASTGLTAQSVALVVKAALSRVGVDADKVSGHSLRAGYCTQAAMVGMPPFMIREQTGHNSDVTLAKYIRPIARRKIPSLF